MDRLEMLYERVRRAPEHSVLLFVDLDGFKMVNNCCGHDVGDKLLCDVAQRLKMALRKTDTVERFGGDEFVVLVEDVGCTAEIKQIGGKLREVLKLPLYCSGQKEPVTASIGMTYIDIGDTPNAVLSRADQAMYYVKSQGRDGVADYHQQSCNERLSA